MEGARVEGLPGYTMARVGDARFYRDRDSRLCVTVSTLLGALDGRIHYDPARRTFVLRGRGPDTQRAAVGNAAHRMAACHALGRSGAPLAGEPCEARAIARNMMRALDSSAGPALAVERNLVSRRLRIGGTVDLVATWRGALAVIEHKTRRSVEPRPARPDGLWPARRQSFMQAAAYAHMWSEATGSAPELLVTLVADSRECVPVVQDAGPWMRRMEAERVSRTVAAMCKLAEAALGA